MEFLNEFWTWFISIAGGVSITGLLSAIIYGSLKGAFNRTIAKINVEKISEQATEKGVEKVKKIAFTQSIQPVVESELKKVTEEANNYLKAELKKTQDKYDKLIVILEKLSAYFDNSIGVPEEKKAELKEAVAKAQNKPVVEQIISVEQEVKEDVKLVTKSFGEVIEQEENTKKNLKVKR